MFLTGEGLNKHCTVHLHNTSASLLGGTTPSNVQVMTWVENADKVTHEFLPLSMDLITDDNVGIIKASVKCPYHGDTAASPIWKMSHSPARQITEIKANSAVPGATNIVTSAAQRSTVFITL